jgi:electron transfer flavoprotein alpha subunit
MAEVLVLAEHTDGEVKKVTFELLTLARRFGEAAVVWTGAGAEAAKDRLAEFGAAKVYVTDNPEFGEYVAAPKAEALAALVAGQSPAAVLIAGTAEGKEIAGRLAVKTGSGVLTDAVDVTEGLTAEQSIFGGSIVVQSKVRTGTPIIVVRPNAVTPQAEPGAAELTPLEVQLSDAAKGAKITESVVQERGERPELTRHPSSCRAAGEWAAPTSSP